MPAPAEETKKHKGKTPSFGNSNAPLFLNYFQPETNPASVGSSTPNTLKTEEIKLDKRSVGGRTTNHSGSILDKFAEPILTNRTVGNKKPNRATYRPSRPASKKASPTLK